MKPVLVTLISAEAASEGVYMYLHYLMQLRGTWSASSSYKCIIILHFKHKTLNTDI